MTSSVTLPLWLVLLLVVFAAIGIADRVFAPSVRWFFRRRVNEAIDELNERLQLRIQPFRLTRWQTHVDRLVYDQKVIEAVEAEARETGTPRAVVMKKAERYAREIVPSLSLTTYFGFGTRAARWLSEFVYRVRLGYSDDEALRTIDPDATVIFVMNHRSNMDYVLAGYLARRLGVPVRLIEDRLENMRGGDMQGPDRTFDLQVAFESDGTVRAIFGFPFPATAVYYRSDLSRPTATRDQECASTISISRPVPLQRARPRGPWRRTIRASRTWKLG
jgi:hypothetical protein